MNRRDQCLKKIDSFNDELINLRRHIHAHPELSGLENQTAILISGFLKNIGWNVRESIGRTGVVADFGPLDKGIIGLRVDMDALPIFEETKLSFSSKVDGVMHACGHDLHISIGLGEKTINQGQANIAYIINAIDQNFPNSEIIRLNNKMTDSIFEGDQVNVSGYIENISTKNDSIIITCHLKLNVGQEKVSVISEADILINN